MTWRVYYGRYGVDAHFDADSLEEAKRWIKNDEDAGEIFAYAIRDMTGDDVYYRNTVGLKFNWVKTDLAGARKVFGKDL